ncbi:MAG: response regulator transcription factor [Spirochaetaceae bacterium]|nr:response regulator transcription factor [Spirochaetaceae bacterium]MBO4705031.1 response regulator transcription factor [Spirochaetaceae bacterium]
MTKTFYIIDDHEMLRLGTCDWLANNSDWVCVGDAGTHDKALADFARMAGETVVAANSPAGANDNANNRTDAGLPSILISDLNFYGENTGFDFISEVHALYPDVKIIVYSMFFAAGIVQSAVRCGASGYVSKNASSAELLNCMEKVLAGEVFIQEELKTSLIKYNNFTDALTRREKEVMELLIRRCSNDDIANKLNIKKRAVENYISAIYEKTGVNDRNELVEKYGM